MYLAYEYMHEWLKHLKYESNYKHTHQCIQLSAFLEVFFERQRGRIARLRDAQRLRWRE